MGAWKTGHLQVTQFPGFEHVIKSYNYNFALAYAILLADSKKHFNNSALFSIKVEMELRGIYSSGFEVDLKARKTLRERHTSALVRSIAPSQGTYTADADALDRHTGCVDPWSERIDTSRWIPVMPAKRLDIRFRHNSARKNRFHSTQVLVQPYLESTQLQILTNHNALSGKVNLRDGYGNLSPMVPPAVRARLWGV